MSAEVVYPGDLPPLAAGLAAELRAAVADLKSVDRRAVVWRLLLLLTSLLGGSWLHWRSGSPLWAAVGLPIAAVAYALLLIATHEAVHGTLLGLPRLEFALSCLISWPMAWPFATYASLHQLHHRWNGLDLRDPERVEPSLQERTRAGRLLLWYQNHPLLSRSLLLGGLGLIVDTYAKGWQLRPHDRRLPGRLSLDLCGSLTLQFGLLSVAALHGAVGRYLLFWLLLERLIGAIVQARGLIEHRGLWGSRGNHRLTQLYASRNVVAPGWLNALMGGLPHHGAHHAFPSIPSQLLPVAHRRIEAVLRSRGWEPLPAEPDYLSALRALG
jgi:fatty acid desaturase